MRKERIKTIIIAVIGVGLLLGATTPSQRVTVTNTPTVVNGGGTVTLNGTSPVSLGSISINGTPTVALGSLSLGSSSLNIGSVTLAGTSPVSLGSISINGAIPSGTNTIGSVTLNASSANIGSVTLAGTSAISLGSISINGAVPAGGNNIGSVTLAGTSAVSLGSLTANIGTTNGLALDATLTGGTQKAIARTAAKGTTAAADLTSTPVDANTQAMDVSAKGGTFTISGALPTGTNNLGSVTLAGTSAVSLGSIVLNTGTNSIGTVTLAAGSANAGSVTLAAGTNAIGKLAANSGVVIGDVNAVQSGTWTVTQAGGNSVSIGTSTNKTNVLKTGALTSSATTADQVIVTYTVTAGKTYYVTGFDVSARLSTFAATATLFGAVSLETPSGTKVYTIDMAGSGIDRTNTVTFSEPIPIAAAAVIRIVTTPGAATSMAWKGNIQGYEK